MSTKETGSSPKNQTHLTLAGQSEASTDQPDEVKSSATPESTSTQPKPTSLRIEQLRRGGQTPSPDELFELVKADIADGVLKDCTKVLVIAVDDSPGSPYLHVYRTEDVDYVSTLGILAATIQQQYNTWASDTND